MNTNAIIMKLNNKNNGQFFKISWMSDVPITASAKAHGQVVYKYTTGTVRKGINYANQKSVQMKVQNEGKVLTHELPWGHYVEGYEGLLIEHKGKTYVRLYTTPNKFKSQFFLNGRPIEREELKKLGIVQNSYWNKPDGYADALTVNTANIQEIW